MKTICNKALYLYLSCIIALGTACSEQHAVYVAPDGSDTNAGTKSKPVATLAGARDRVRDLLKAGPSRDIDVWLAGGVYHVDGPVEFTPEDSGPEGLTVRYRAVPGATPAISGGVEIGKWTRQSGGVWSARLPEIFDADTELRELFVGGRRAQRARHPNTGYLRVQGVGEDRRTNFYFGENDFPMPGRVEDTELVFLHDWSSSRIRLSSVEAASRRLTTIDTIGPGSPAFFAIDNWEPHPRYYLENDLVFLDSMYEWYADRSAGEIFILLPEGKHPDSMQIVAPYATGLLHFEGSPERYVSNLRFEGLTFEYCRWNLPKHGYGGVQACHYDPGSPRNGWGVVPPAIGGSWLQGVVLERCTIRHMGGSGLWFGAGSRNCAAIECAVSDVSGNGLMVGEGRDRTIDGAPWYDARPEQAAFGNTIQGCIISLCGQQFFGAVGIWCGLTAGTTISANDVTDMPYTGISIGWMWSPQPTPCRDNHVEANHIHHIMRQLSDGGGIYMLGLQPGSRLAHNLIHSVTLNVGRAESNGMFLDEGTTDVVVEENIIYDIAKSPLRFHRATTNLVQDNVLMCGEGIPPIRYNNTLEENIRKEGNRILSAFDPDDRRVLEQAISAWQKQWR